jgi:hypothetical protein
MFSQSSRVALVCCLALVFLACHGLSFSAEALPLETFEAPLSIKCSEGQRECGGTLRVDGSLGRHTGISIVKGLSGEVSLRVAHPSGKLSLRSEGVSDLTVLFSWDGDSNSEMLSGAGLNCFDLAQQGAYAFILSKLSLEVECASDTLVSDCPSVTIDSRVYDSADPTGQRFSASTITAPSFSGGQLAVPYSNFLRSGPRGKGSLSCAGAVTIALKFNGLEDLKLEMGPIYTNGKEGVRPLPTVVVTQIVDTPTPVPNLAVSKSDSYEPTAQAELTASAALVTPEAAPRLGSSRPADPALTAIVATTPRAIKRPQVQEESVYGSVVVGE